MNTEYTKATLPPAEAIKLAHKLRRGRAFFIMVQNMAPIAGQPDRAFPTLASVRVSHADGLEYIKNAYEGFAARGALVPITYSDSLLWIG